MFCVCRSGLARMPLILHARHPDKPGPTNRGPVDGHHRPAHACFVMLRGYLARQDVPPLNDTSLAMRRKRLLLDLLIMASLTGVTAWISLAIARIPGGVAAVWISNGIWAGWLL